MLNNIDLFGIVILLFALWDGWRAGLLRSLITPASLTVFIPISIINFDLNHNIAVALSILFIGGACLATLIRAILFISRRGMDQDFRNYVFWGSRLLGSVVSVGWKGIVLAVALLVISLIPASAMPGLADRQKDIVFSRTYFYIDQYFLSRLPFVKNVYMTLSVFKDHAQVQELADTKEFAEFFQSAKVQAFIKDEGVKSFLSGRHYLQLLTHPKLKAILTDDELMRKLTNLSRRIYEQKFNSNGLVR